VDDGQVVPNVAMPNRRFYQAVLCRRSGAGHDRSVDMRYDFCVISRQKCQFMSNESPGDNEVAIAAQSFRCRAIERLNADFGLPKSQDNSITAEANGEQTRGNETKRVSGWWLPSGIVVSIAAKYFGLKSIFYTSNTPYTIAMGCALLMFLLGISCFKRQQENNNKLDLSSGPAILVKLFGWQMALMAFLLGWIVGDWFIFKFQIS
jgi:hypothetical protein